MTIPKEYDVEELARCISSLDSWACTGPDKELDCRIAFALGHDWFDDDNSWRDQVQRDGFHAAWTLPQVWGRDFIPRYTSSYDAVLDEITNVMPEADQINWSCDPSGCGAAVGVWRLSVPVSEDENHQPYIWPHGKGYANSGLHAMLRAFLQAVLQRETGERFKAPENGR